MIARLWRGRTRREDADAYASYLEETGMQSARAIPGNRGTLVLSRRDGEAVEFVTVLLWESADAVRAFAGADIGRAVFFPEDDRFLVERDLHVTHYETNGLIR